MRITINGKLHDSEPGVSVKALLESLGFDPRKIAVERNLMIVPRSLHPSTLLQDGDKLEIVNFVGGG